MRKLEIFFDYACPYCARGHEYIAELIPKYASLEIDWRPCEAHPRPDRYGRHSDLCARGMYFALDHDADIMEYHNIMYRAAVFGRADIEDLRVVSRLVGAILDPEAFRGALSNGAYLDRLSENNRLAWGEYRFPAVPSCRLNGDTLKSTENIGLSKSQLSEFIKRHHGTK